MIVTKVHPTAVVHPNAKLSDGVIIGPFSVVEEGARLEDNVRLFSHVVISGQTKIGSGTTVHPFACLGGLPQDKKYAGEPTSLTIGKNCVIREHVTINSGTMQGQGKTIVGDRCLIMSSCHIGHDCVLENDVVLSTGSSLAGHVRVDERAIIGGNAGVRQRTHIGRSAMVGGMTCVLNDVIPYGLVAGTQGHLAGLNLRGLRRMGISNKEIQGMQKAFRYIFEHNHPQAKWLTWKPSLFERTKEVEFNLNNGNVLEADVVLAKSRIKEILDFILYRSVSRPLAVFAANDKINAN